MNNFSLDQIKVVLLENIHERAAEICREAGFTVEHHSKAYQGDELLEVAGDAHIVPALQNSADADFTESSASMGNRMLLYWNQSSRSSWWPPGDSRLQFTFFQYTLGGGTGHQ